MNRRVIIAAALAIAAGAGLAASGYSLVIGTQPSSERAIVVNGKTYVPVSVLKALGVTSSLQGSTLTLSSSGAAGGALERPSLEGCAGEWLFNGIWRIRVGKLERISRDANTPGWGLTVELKNGTKAQLTPALTGVDGTGGGVQLAFSDATTIPVDGLEVQKLTFAALPPGGLVTLRLPFYYPFGTKDEAVRTPTKFLFEIKPKGFEDSMKKSGVGYTVPNPSLRVRLDCQK